VPMFEAFTMFTMCEHLRNAVFEPPLGKAGYPRQLDPARQPFPTADGHVVIVPYTDDQQQQIFHLMGAPEVLEMEELKDMASRFRNSTTLYNEIAKRTPLKTSAEWIAIFRAEKIPAMEVRDLNDVVNDPHLHATDFFHVREHPDSGHFREMRPPVRYSADPDRELRFAPKLDEHGEEIRRELGL
jgi:crotonobetainyl-CoA:carnitine CoA-transferase CaiB-like acyl-CoA transferase